MTVSKPVCVAKMSQGKLWPEATWQVYLVPDWKKN